MLSGVHSCYRLFVCSCCCWQSGPTTTPDVSMAERSANGAVCFAIVCEWVPRCASECRTLWMRMLSCRVGRIDGAGFCAVFQMRCDTLRCFATHCWRRSNATPRSGNKFHEHPELQFPDLWIGQWWYYKSRSTIVMVVFVRWLSRHTNYVFKQMLMNSKSLGLESRSRVQV